MAGCFPAAATTAAVAVAGAAGARLTLASEPHLRAAFHPRRELQIDRLAIGEGDDGVGRFLDQLDAIGVHQHGGTVGARQRDHGIRPGCR